MKIKLPSSVVELEQEILSFVDANKHEADLKREKTIRRHIADAAGRHSVDLELRTHYPFFRPQHVSQTVRKEAVARHMRAWAYALEKVAPEGTYGTREIMQIGLYIAPNQQFHPGNGFREGDVKISGATHQPPAPHRLLDELLTLSTDVRNRDSRFERALLSHYGITRIHPLEDGNGRTARILQNAILAGGGLLPFKVDRTERDIYLAALDATDKLYYSGDVRCLDTLAEFAVNKEYSAFKELKGSIRNKRT
ncbi:MAG: Fic family protein [Candidatus Woesearchaeota archaeon]